MQNIFNIHQRLHFTLDINSQTENHLSTKSFLPSILGPHPSLRKNKLSTMQAPDEIATLFATLAPLANANEERIPNVSQSLTTSLLHATGRYCALHVFSPTEWCLMRTSLTLC